MSEVRKTSPRSRVPGALLGLGRQREYGVLALLAVTVAVVACINRAFLSPANVRDMLVQCVPIAIIACGMTLVIVTGEIDISVGSMMGLLAAVMGILASTNRMGLPVALAAALTLALGAGLGLVNGLFVTFGRVPSIIVTLGMLTALRGVTELVMGGNWITGLPSSLRFLGTGALLGIPVCVWVAGIVALGTILFARWVRWGRWVYAVGGNAEAARLAGLPVRRLKILAFVLTGFLTAVATLVSVTQLSVIESGIGDGQELRVITCVVVGGTSISGGQGSILGSLLAVLLLGPVRTDLIFLRLGEKSTYWEAAVQGAFILLAVFADHLVRRRSAAEVRP